MSQVYCKAPWTSTCYMPGGKYTPCCAWHGPHFESPEQIIAQLGPIFKNNQAPEPCQGACPVDQPGWRQHYEKYSTDFESLKIQFLDFRNSNLCNMKCRSCGPGFSSSWAQELGQKIVLSQQPVNFDNIDLSRCQHIYFAGGEPLLNYQHYELLQYLIDCKKPPLLTYSTNLSSLTYKTQHIKDFWKHFPSVYVNVSLDAVDQYAEFVRTGTDWDEIESNIAWVKQQPNLILTFSPVISAINIWWIDKLFDYIAKNIDQPKQCQPVLASDTESISLIPMEWRQPLIDQIKNCGFQHENLDRAVFVLETVDNSSQWLKFVSKQLAMDLQRNESWFNNLPIKNELYQWIIKQ